MGEIKRGGILARKREKESEKKSIHSFGLCYYSLDFCFIFYVYFLSFYSPGEALDIYDILKLTHNGVLEEDPDTEKDHKAQKETILDSSM